MSAFRILVADDHEVVRRGLVALLHAQPDWQVCGEAAEGRDAVEKTSQLKPDVVILDIGMPNLNGLEATRQILKINPQARVLILTLHDSDHVVREVLSAGARGFLLKSDAGRDLVAAVDALRTFSDSPVARKGLVQAIAKQDSPMVQVSLIDALTDIRDHEAVPVLQALAKDAKASPEVRQRAQWALGRMQ